MVRFVFAPVLLLAAGLISAHPTATRDDLVPRQSFSTSEVSSKFQSLSSEIEQVRTSLAGGQISTEVARQQVQKIASEMNSSFSSYNGCPSCINGGGSNLAPVISNVFQQFNSLVQTSRSTFGSNFSNVFGSSFNQASDSMSQFFNSASRSGVQLNQIVPQGFTSTLNQINMGSAASSLSQSGFWN